MISANMFLSDILSTIFLTPKKAANAATRSPTAKALIKVSMVGLSFSEKALNFSEIAVKIPPSIDPAAAALSPKLDIVCTSDDNASEIPLIIMPIPDPIFLNASISAIALDNPSKKTLILSVISTRDSVNLNSDDPLPYPEPNAEKNEVTMDTPPFNIETKMLNTLLITFPILENDCMTFVFSLNELKNELIPSATPLIVVNMDVNDPETWPIPENKFENAAPIVLTMLAIAPPTFPNVDNKFVFSSSDFEKSWNFFVIDTRVAACDL